MKRPVLAIDFGGSFLMGASRVNDLDEPVGTDQSPHLPSLVFVGPDGRLTAGGPVEQLAEAFPDRVVDDLRKLLVTRESVHVADREVPAVALAAAALRQVMLDAAQQRKVERFDRVVLTYPARWGSRQLASLGRAASEAGLPQPWFVSEAEAVAAFHDTRPGTSVAVYDLGGRSLDVAVVRRTEQGLEVLGQAGGHDRFGGGDLDRALLRIVAERARGLDAAAWDELESRGNGLALIRQEVLAAKRALSERETASLRFDGFAEEVTVTRAEFEDATEQMLRWSVDELLAAIESAGLSPADLGAVYLAGGASRMPKVAELITERLDRAPTTAGDPKAVFALGALNAYAQTAVSPAAETAVSPAAETAVSPAAETAVSPAAETAVPHAAPHAVSPAVPFVRAADAPPVVDGGFLPGLTESAPVRRAGPRLSGRRWAVLAVIPVAAAVIAGSLLLRSHLGPSESASSSSGTTALPAAPTGSSAPPLPSPTVSETDTPTPTPAESSEPPEESPTSGDGAGIEEGTYSVTLTGTVSGHEFERTAELTVKSTVTSVGTSNGVNPIEVCLRSGFPAGVPEVGAIWFGTTTACFPERGAQLDMATVELSGDTVTVEPDAQIAAAGLNQFTASGDSIYSCLYKPVSGSMTVTFSGGSASGELDVGGYSGPCSAVGTNATYSARFNG